MEDVRDAFRSVDIVYVHIQSLTYIHTYLYRSNNVWFKDTVVNRINTILPNIPFYHTFQLGSSTEVKAFLLLPYVLYH